jgi:hypothetical protein
VSTNVNMLDLDDAWESFCDGDYKPTLVVNKKPLVASKDVPKCTPIYISTKTKISYLNYPIDLMKIFWEVPITQYHIPKSGVIKKQMKFNSSSQEELDKVLSNCDDNVFTDHYILSRIVKPEGRITFRDIRKISQGLCKKDITSYRCKRKGAFYNCFALTLRIEHENSFKEIHVKVFNTGKLEIPGIQDDSVLVKTLDLLIKTLRPLVPEKNKLDWLKDKSETVLINSNFSCGYFINRDKLYNRLKYHYRINSAYDPCSYPGIQCEFYFNPESEVQTGQHPPSGISDEERERFIKMSFMVFRTGSVLIVGRCKEDVLGKIYEFLIELLESEYQNVGGGLISIDAGKHDKTKKVRKKTILVS